MTLCCRFKYASFLLVTVVLLELGCSQSTEDGTDLTSATGGGGSSAGGNHGSGGTGAQGHEGGQGAGGPSGGGFPTATAQIVVSERYNWLFNKTWSSSIEARVRDAPLPVLHEVFMAQGKCQYLKVKAGTCIPPCNFHQQYCTLDDECKPYPLGISAGTLMITGLSEAIAIDPQTYDPGLYYGPDPLPEDLFSPGQSLAATFTGTTFPAATLEALGVAPIDTTLATQGLDNMLPGQDFELSWTPGTDPNARIRAVIRGINIAHGAPLDDIIWCEDTDTGSLIIPHEMVDEFLKNKIPGGCSHFDCPQSELTRFHFDQFNSGDQLIELTVQSSVYFAGAPQIG